MELAAAIGDGVGALVAGDLRGAVRRLQGCLVEAPFHPVVHFDLAVAYRLQGRLSPARGHARLAAELHGSAAAHALYGVHLHLALRRDLARPQLERAIALDPAYGLARLYLALVDREEGLRDDAIRGLRAALDLALPPLVEQRARGQLFDLERDGALAPVPTQWCAVCVVTEVLWVDGSLRWLDPPAAPPARLVAPSPARERTPDEVALALHAARRVVALTGAGLSAGSGLPTRKDLWKRHDRDQAVSIAGHARDPQALWRVVRELLAGGAPRPNPAHDVLARLPRRTALLTQNVDDLHHQAALPGGPPIHELHGTLERMVCTRCGQAAGRALDYVQDYVAAPWCACGGVLRPDVVLFGEHLALRDLGASVAAVQGCDLLLVVGCAMDVSPAAELPRLAAAAGARVIEVKRGPSRLSDAIGSELLLGPAEDTLPRVYERLRALEALPALPERASEPPGVAVPRPAVPVHAPAAEAVLARWRRRPGDRVARGEVIAELETDKVCVEVEAPRAGILRRARASPEQEVAPAEVIAEIEADDGEGAVVPVRPRSAPPLTEVLEPATALFVPLGPHARFVRERIVALDAARWFAVERAPGLEDALHRHVAAYARALRLPALEVAWFAERTRAVAAWSAAWLGADGLDPGTLAWREAHPARPDVGDVRSLVSFVVGRARARIHALHGASRVPRSAPSALGEVLDRSVAEWIAYGEDLDRPGPFDALLAIYRLGAWPFALPGGRMGLYLATPADLHAGPAGDALSSRALRRLPGLAWLPAGR